MNNKTKVKSHLMERTQQSPSKTKNKAPCVLSPLLLNRALKVKTTQYDKKRKLDVCRLRQEI